jgi:hypothetical protein
VGEKKKKMNYNMINILSPIIAGLVAIIGNIIFYILVKNRIDKSIENYKISYAGIYKEKIEIHKEILKQISELKLKIQRYRYSRDQQLSNELLGDFNRFINLYTINRPFIKQEILNALRMLTTELQSCFENFEMYNLTSHMDKVEPKIRLDSLKMFFESGNKFKKDEPFKQIEDLIIAEMKKDLKIDE